MIQESGTIGKAGIFVIPAALRKRFGWREGSLVVAEEREEGVLIRPTSKPTMEQSPSKQKAEFLTKSECDEMEPESLKRKRALMLLPLDDRHALMEEQAQELAQYYADDQPWKDTEGGVTAVDGRRWTAASRKAIDVAQIWR